MFVDIFEHFMMFHMIYRIFYVSFQERLFLLLFQYKKKEDMTATVLFFKILLLKYYRGTQNSQMELTLTEKIVFDLIIF